MNKLFAALLLSALLFSCSSKQEENNSVEKANEEQTEKAIKPLPTNLSNRISIKRQFLPNEEQEIFVLDLKGENLKSAKLCFVILNKNRDTLFSRTNISGKSILEGTEEEFNTEDEQFEYLLHHMSAFFSVKNFSSPPYTINDPNSDDFNGNKNVWNEIENDSTVTCFEFSLLPNQGSEVIVYSRLLDSILVYDRTH